MDLDVRRSDAGARAHERAGLGHARGDRPGLVEQVLDAVPGGLVPAILAVVADGRRLGREVDVHVVLEVLADSRQVVDDRDPERSQLVGGPDPGQQQQARRVDRPARDDDLAARVDPRLGRLVLGEVLDADRPTVLDDQLGGLGVRRDDQVLALARRPEVRGRRALPADVSLGDVVEADAGLLGAVEVVAERDADALGRPHEPLRDRVVGDLLGDVHRAAGAVVLVGEPLVVLGLAEVRQDAVVAPALVAEIPPLVVVEPIAADVDHRVDRRAAPERAALRVVHPPVVQLRLGDRLEAPVDARPGQLREPGGHVDQRVPVAAAGLEQEHRLVRVLAEPGRDGTAGRAGSDDDMGVALSHRVPPSTIDKWCGVRARSAARDGLS